MFEKYLNEESLNEIYEFLAKEGLDWALNIIAALAIFFIGRWVGVKLVGLVKKAMARAQVDPTLISFIGNILNTLVLIFVIIAAISKLGVETSSLAAILAAAGLAIGLSLQGSLSNLAAGVMIISFRPFRAGDYVEVAGIGGVVEEVSIFNSRLRSPDNKSIIVPNGSIINDPIINYSAKDTRRLDLVMGIGYDDDIKKAKDVLIDILENDPRVLKDPAYNVAVLSLGDSSVNFAVRPWVKTSDYWDAHFAITEAVKLRFDAAGISIPFPQRDVHLYHENQPAKEAA